MARIVSGVIGVGVDVATGAAKDHYPNPVIINLVKEGSVSRPAKEINKKSTSAKPTS